MIKKLAAIIALSLAFGEAAVADCDTESARIFTNNADASIKSLVKCKSNFKSDEVSIIAK
jgi:hypothetical protein